MKHPSTLYKRLFVYEIFLISIHIFTFTGIIRFTNYLIGILGFLTLISLIYRLYIKPSKKKISSFQLKDCNVPFPRFAQAIEWEDFEKHRINEETPITIPLLVPSLKINDLIHQLLNNVINEFILTWYNTITPSRSFLYELENEIYRATSIVINHLKNVNFEDVIGKKVLPILNNHIHEFGLARKRISTINSGNPEIKIAMYYNHGKLHPAVLPTLNSTQKLEYNHLRKIFEKVIPILLNEKLKKSRAVIVLIREIVVCKVMQPLVELLSDPDFYNQQFIDLSEKFFGKPDYIQYVNEALGNNQYKKQIEIPQTYDDFLRMIKECNNLRTACLLRSDIIKEIKLNKAQIANLNRTDVVNGVKVSRIQDYISRIESALKLCEKRIKELGGPDFQRLENNIDIPSSLYDVLSTPLGRYYFTQYMEHHNQSNLYNFWMEVQRLRILPEITPENKEEVIEESKSLNPVVDKETIRENVWNIYNTYLFPDANDYNQKVEMSPSIINSIEIFLYGRQQQLTALDIDAMTEEQNAELSYPSGNPDYDYTCIFKAQKYVYDLMESKYYSKFVKSTLYFRFLHDLTSDDEYRNKILQRISNIGYNNHYDLNTGLPLPNNNGKFRGKVKNNRRKRENSISKRSMRRSSYVGRHNSSSYSDKNRKHVNRRRSNYSLKKIHLGSTHYNNRLIPKEQHILLNNNIHNNNNNNNNININNNNVNNNNSNNSNTTANISTSLSPIPNKDLSANQMQLLNEAINNPITNTSDTTLNNKSVPLNVTGTIDKGNERLSPVAILENYKNKSINKQSNDNLHKLSNSPHSNDTFFPEKKLVNDPQSFIMSEHSPRQFSDKPSRRFSQRYYTVNEYFEDDGTMDNLEEEYVDDFDDDESSVYISSYSPSVISTSYSTTRFSINSHNEFHTRRRRGTKRYNSIRMKRHSRYKSSKEESILNSLKNDFLHLNKDNKPNIKEDDNEWEDEEDYLFFNTSNLYSYDGIPDMSLNLSMAKTDDGKSTDTESKTITYDFNKDKKITSPNEDTTSPLPSPQYPSSELSENIITNHDYINLTVGDNKKSQDQNIFDHEKFNPTQTIYYNTNDHEEINSSNPVSDLNSSEEKTTTQQHELPPPPNIVIRQPSEDDKILQIKTDEVIEEDKRSIASNDIIPSDSMMNDKDEKQNSNISINDSGKGKEKKKEKKKDKNKDKNNDDLSRRGSNLSITSDPTLSRKSSFKEKLKNNLSLTNISNNNSSINRKPSFKEIINNIGKESGSLLGRKHDKKKNSSKGNTGENEKVSKEERKKSNGSIKSNLSENSKISKEEKNKNIESTKDTVDGNENISNEDKNNNNKNDMEIRKSPVIRSGYASDGEYDKLDYVPPIDGVNLNKRSGSNNIKNDASINKRESSSFSISNSLKMEILNSEENKEEKKEEEEDYDEGSSILYKDKYSLHKKGSSDSQRSHKGLKKLFNSKIKRKEKKKLLEDARKIKYDDEERDSDIEDTRSTGISIASDEVNDEGTVTSFHYASPGDLLVSSLIAQVDESMKELEIQKKNIDDLMTNAILNKETRRLELLQDAKNQLENHVHDLMKQKELYIIQAKENAITPENVTISIPDCHIKHDGNKNYALYIIEVNRTNPNGCTSGWIVTRRYSEFVLLHQQLRNKFWHIINRYELPGKNMFSWIIPKPDVQLRRVAIEKRRIALEKYLTNLLSHEEICQSIELRKFISQQNVDMPPSFKYKQLNLDELKEKNATNLESEGSLASLSAIPLTKEETNSNNSWDINESNYPKHITQSMPNIHQELNHSDEIRKSATVQESRVKHNDEKSGLPAQTLSDINLDNINSIKGGKIIDGIFDIIMEIFDIKNKIDWYNWLQHKAFLSFFQQIFSGTLDKKIRQGIQYLVSENMIELYLNTLNNSLWPEGEFFVAKRNREWEENHIPFERTEEQKKKSKIECYQKLTTQLPELLGSLIGKKKANYGAEFLFELFQNRRLNQHLIYSLFDEIFKSIFPEIDDDQN